MRTEKQNDNLLIEYGENLHGLTYTLPWDDTVLSGADLKRDSDGTVVPRVDLKKAIEVLDNPVKRKNRTAMHDVVIRAADGRKMRPGKRSRLTALCIAGPQGLDVAEFTKNGLSRDNIFIVDSNADHLQNAMRVQGIKKGKGFACALENLAPYLEAQKVKLDIALFDLTQGMKTVIDILAPMFSASVWAKQCKIGIVYSKRCPDSRDYKEEFFGGNYNEGFRQAASFIMGRDVAIIQRESYRTGSNMAWNVLQANL